MVCPGLGINNVLHTFRSHRNLRSQRRQSERRQSEQGHQQHTEQYHDHGPVHHQRPVPNMAQHARQPSDTSSYETLKSYLSFRRPSTRQTGGSLEINPLGLHPPSEDLGEPRAVLRSPPRHHYERQRRGTGGSPPRYYERRILGTGGSPPRHHYGRQRLGTSGSMSSNDSMDSQHPTLGFRALQSLRDGPQDGNALQIYDGFDFGLENQAPRADRNPTAGGAAGNGRDNFGLQTKIRSPTPTPGGGDDYLQPKSHWSPSPTPTPGTGNEYFGLQPGTGDAYFGLQPKSHWSRSPTPTPGTGEEEEEDDLDETQVPGQTPDTGEEEEEDDLDETQMPEPTPGTSEEEQGYDADETQGPGLAPGRAELGDVARPRCRPPGDPNSFEYFVKRGDWKRRGIVFNATIPIASEMCFKLPMASEEDSELEG